MDVDFSECFQNLFEENKCETFLKLQFSFLNSPKNEAIVVNNCVYYKKTEKLSGHII